MSVSKASGSGILSGVWRAGISCFRISGTGNGVWVCDCGYAFGFVLLWLRWGGRL
jgi:hypothetical protein